MEEFWRPKEVVVTQTPVKNHLLKQVWKNHMKYKNKQMPFLIDHNGCFTGIQIELQIKLLLLDNNTWNDLTLWKQMNPGSYKNCYQQTIHL